MTVVLHQKASKSHSGGASRFLLFDAFYSVPPMQITCRYHQHMPWRAVAEDTANFALKFRGTAAELRAEFAGERSQAFVANLETYFGDGALRSEHLLGAVHAKPGEKIMRSLAESSA